MILSEFIFEKQGLLPLLRQFELLNKVILNVNDEEYKKKGEPILKKNRNIDEMREFALFVSTEKVLVDPLDARIYKKALFVSE